MHAVFYSMIQHICKSQNHKLFVHCPHKVKWRWLSTSGLKLFRVSERLKLRSNPIVLILSSRVVKLSACVGYRECKMSLLLATHYSPVSKIGLNSRIASVLDWCILCQQRSSPLGNCVFYCFQNWSLTWRGFCSVLYGINYVSSSPYLLALQCFA